MDAAALLIASTLNAGTVVGLAALGLGLVCLGAMVWFNGMLTLLFAVLIGVIGTLATVYSISYLSASEKFGRFYPYLLAFGGSMLGLVLSDNLPVLFMFWEMTSVTSFLLIGLWHTRGAARDGAVKAFLISALGGLALTHTIGKAVWQGFFKRRAHFARTPKMENAPALVQAFATARDASRSAKVLLAL